MNTIYCVNGSDIQGFTNKAASCVLIGVLIVYKLMSFVIS